MNKDYRVWPVTSIDPDIAETVFRVSEEVSSDPRFSREHIAEAIQAERNRCLSIIDAECEWGGDLRAAEARIHTGKIARAIPGYNCPSDMETDE